jgi:hypothetical protein
VPYTLAAITYCVRTRLFPYDCHLAEDDFSPDVIDVVLCDLATVTWDVASISLSSVFVCGIASLLL